MGQRSGQGLKERGEETRITQISQAIIEKTCHPIGTQGLGSTYTKKFQSLRIRLSGRL